MIQQQEKIETKLWTVTLLKLVNQEDLDNGAMGKYLRHDVLVCCTEQDILKSVSPRPGYTMDRYEDWGLAQTRLHTERMAYMFDFESDI